MAPKRKQPDSASNIYFPSFPFYDGADLVVESKDGILFATRALYLRAVSSVCDDILSLPNQEDTVDGKPCIEIEEAARIFEHFLRYAHRDRLLVNGQPPSPSWPDILALSKVFDKYDSPSLARAFLTEQLPRFIQDPSVSSDIRGPAVVPGTQVILPLAVDVFAVAAIHHLEDIAKKSLRWASVSGLRENGARVLLHNDPKNELALSRDWRYGGLQDLSSGLLPRIPTDVVVKYMRLYTKVLTTPGYSWIKAGDYFKTHPVTNSRHSRTHQAHTLLHSRHVLALALITQDFSVAPFLGEDSSGRASDAMGL